ncbi:MAG: hypothetical protein JXR49_23030 [Acidobacteria bacterium]|nr:hypothetical protein [Acidobacteriota bacterium]
MTHNISGKAEKKKKHNGIRSQGGFSALEVLISVCILIPIMAGAMHMFSEGVNQHASEQESIEANQDASAGFNLMTTEIAQAGSHGDKSTTIQQNIIGSTGAQAVSVASSDGFCIGDFIQGINNAGDLETVEIVGVGSNTINAVFLNDYVVGDKIRLFAMPYLDGVLPPTATVANGATPVTTLRFFGDIYGDGNLYYVEYAYDSQNAQITRSMTPFSQTYKEPAVPLITGLQPSATPFFLHTNDQNVITSITVSFTVENQRGLSPTAEEIALSSKITIPSVVAASNLLKEILLYGGVNHLPPIPQRISFYTSI